jgi:hypothetical protein
MIVVLPYANALQMFISLGFVVVAIHNGNMNSSNQKIYNQGRQDYNNPN